MTVLGMDPTAQWMALVGASFLLLGVIAVIVFVAMFRRERNEAVAEAAKVERENARLRELYDGLLRRSDVPALQAQIGRLQGEKADVLGDLDVLRRQLTESRAEAFELRGRIEDQAAQLAEHNARNKRLAEQWYSGGQS